MRAYVIKFDLNKPFVFKPHKLTIQEDFKDGPVPILNQFVSSLGGVEVGTPNLTITITDGCQGPRLNYVKEDVAQICGNGRTSGGVCKVMP